MKLSFRTPVLATATLAGLLVLTACGKKEEQTNAPAASSTAPAAASTAAAAAPAATSTAPAAAAPASPTSAAAAAATPAAPAAAPAPATAADTLKVGTVTLGSAVGADKKVAKAKTAFAPNEKTIYASVATEGASAGATLNAKWTFQDGETTTTVSDISQSISTDGPAVTTFKIQNPNEWPEGKYKVTISLNGKPAGDTAFDVKKK
jgi:pyruvate/2-oxoglutarate dehydrogenase complex dihydrolipoamide acyltransferase (E2) component